jgi:hypothetical protein
MKLLRQQRVGTCPRRYATLRYDRLRGLLSNQSETTNARPSVPPATKVLSATVTSVVLQRERAMLSRSVSRAIPRGSAV